VASKTRWVLVDQVCSSLSNFLVVLLVARAGSAQEFGAFALALTVYQFLAFLGRAVASDSLVIRYSTASESEWRVATTAATGVALSLGGVAGIVIVAASVLVGGPVGAILWRLGLALPALLIQDTFRYSFFAASNPGKAAVNDLAWLASLIVMSVALALASQTTAVNLVGAWLAGAALAGALGARQARAVPNPLLAWWWLSLHRDIAGRSTIECLLEGGAVQAVFLIVGAVSGLAALGTLKAAQILLGPVYVVFQGAQTFVVPEGARLRASSPGSLQKAVRVVATVLACAAALWGVLLLLLPDGAGEILLGESWAGARPLILPLTILTVAFGVTVSADSGLRALAAVDRTMLASIIGAPLIVGLTLAGAILADARGAAVGWAAANCALAAFLWSQFRLANRAPLAGQQAHSK
jgi:O-antigen/teichoic acid export membrane protein